MSLQNLFIDVLRDERFKEDLTDFYRSLEAKYNDCFSVLADQLITHVKVALSFNRKGINEISDGERNLIIDSLSELILKRGYQIKEEIYSKVFRAEIPINVGSDSGRSGATFYVCKRSSFKN